MKKKENQILYKGILLIIILTVLLNGCGTASIPLTDGQTNKDNVSTTEYERQTALAAPNAASENILSIERPEDRMTYLRSLLMGLLEIPEQLGDSCYVKIIAGCDENQPYSHIETVDGGTRYNCEAFGTAYYIKNNIYYERSSAYITWNELLNSEQEIQYLYNARSRWVNNELFGEKLLNEEELNELYTKKNEQLMTISGTLSQELYPLGQKLGYKYPLWDDNILEAGLWYTKLTGECFGNIVGDIYVVEPSEKTSSGSYWICFEGMEPIKIPRINAMTYQLTEAPATVEGADFEKEKENVLFRLSFDLLVEPAQDTQN